MLKLKAAPGASLIALFTGISRHGCTSFRSNLAGQHGVVSSKRSLISLERFYAARRKSGSLVKGIENQKLSLRCHSSLDEEDKFSELGPPQGQGIGTIPKLMTEKREPFKKTVNTRKASSSSPSNNSAASLRPNCSRSRDISGSSHDKKGLKISWRKSVTIKNVPSMIQLPELEEAMSTFGNISNASMRTVPNGLDCYDIEFESVASRDKALSVGRITVSNCNFSIHPLDAINTVAITIDNICSETDDSAIRILCKSYGGLEGLVRKKEDIVDVLFGVKDKSEGQRILRKLNNTIMDGCKWSAHLQTEESSAQATTKENAQLCSVSKVNDYIQDLKARGALLQLLTEDLDNLHHSLLHLENDPLSSN